MKEFIESECDAIAKNFLALRSLSSEIACAARLIIDSLKANGKVMFCGNGGSAADAQHLAAELSGRYEIKRNGLAGLALTTDTSAITAIANDFGYESIFARQIEALGRAGDVLYAISTSGNSPNVLAAIDMAHKLGIKVIAITGFSGGKMKELGDVLINVPADKANHCQELHIAVGHLICGLVERSLDG